MSCCCCHWYFLLHQSWHFVHHLMKFSHLFHYHWPPLWSSSQSSWLQIQRSRFRFPALPDFLNSGSGTGSTQPREDNWGAIWKDSSGSGQENRN
jgi:hypothetical protein